MLNITEKLNCIFKQIHNWSNCNEETKLRNSKISLRDAVYYRFMYSQIDKTKQEITSYLNFTNDCNISRTSYDRKENNISIKLYTKILDDLRSFYYTNCSNTGTLILSVDGTFNNTNTKYKTLDTSLNMGFHDVSNDIPYDLKFIGSESKNNEIKQLREYIENNNISNVIFVADRGYFSYELFEYLDKKNIGFVIRIKDNCKLLDKNYKPKKHDKNKKIMNSLLNNKKIRFVQYECNTTKILKLKTKDSITVNTKSKFNLITNLDETNDRIKEIYNSRWKVETLFKLIKSNFKFSYMREKEEVQYSKLILAELILIYVSKILKYLYIKNKIITNNKIKRKTKDNIEVNISVNESNIIKGIYNSLLKYLIYGELDLNKIHKFMESYIVIIKNEKDRNFPRICRLPFRKWYVKMYHDIYKFSKIKQKINNDKINELHPNLKTKMKNLNII